MSVLTDREKPPEPQLSGLGVQKLLALSWVSRSMRRVQEHITVPRNRRSMVELKFSTCHLHNGKIDSGREKICTTISLSIRYSFSVFHSRRSRGVK